METLKRITVTEAKIQDQSAPGTLSFTIKTPTDILTLSLGETKEIKGDSFVLEMQSDLYPQVSSTVVIGEESDAWVEIDEGVSVRILTQIIQESKDLRKLSIPGLGVQALSNCEYIRKLQEIEEKERQVSSLLMQSKMKAPIGYRDYFDSSPRSAAKRSPLKKKNTMDSPSFAQFQPDFEYSSYFDVNLESISAQEAKLLEHTAFGMMKKLQSLKFDVEEYELTQELMYEFDSPIKNLKESIVETKEEFAKQNSTIFEVKAKILTENEVIADELLQISESNSALLEEIQKYKEEISRQLEVNKKDKEIEGLSETQQLRLRLETLQNEIQGLESEYTKAEKDFNRAYPEQELAKVVNEKVMRLGELQRMITVRDSALQEGILLSAELAEVEGLESIQQDRELTISVYSQEINAFEGTNKHINLQLKEIQGESEENLQSSKLYLQDLESTLDPISEKISEREAVLQEKQQNLSEANEKLEEILKGNSNLSIILEKEKQILSEYNELQGEFIGSSLGQAAMMSELENLSNSLLKVAQNSVTAGRLLRRTEDMVEEQELQQLSMYKLISLIKETKPAYIAVQNDSTDMALAKYLNARHKTLEVSLKRTDKEKYVFGSMRVEIKLEDELLVYAEGRKMGIEEFLDGFSLLEKEKTVKRSNSKVSEKGAKDARPSFAKTGKAPLIPLMNILKKAK